MDYSRRQVLGALGAGSVLVGGFAVSSGRQRNDVSILAAGSLNDALENGLRADVAVPLRVEAHGSARVARLVADEQKDPDIVSVADAALFDSPLDPAWFCEFATNSLVVAYNPETEGGRRVADAGSDGWYRSLSDGSVTLGRTDPDLDPLGYRTLFMLDLATNHYGTDSDLRTVVPQRSRTYPETRLVSQFETGSIDAAVTYRNMAVERGYEYLDLPPEIDLSDPRYTDRYATTSYELPSGKTVRGGVIRYAATARDRRQSVADVFETHVTGDYLTDFGFAVPNDYPRYTDNVPDAFTD
ncbi:extracellular solute-binding protein [Haloarcula nitratireducens]|uniref:Substrate-binding domain-containing protein n=1 Tax=Haloarcula nitratireducens TaxID=2487749 RepID=A0AAW4PHA1_9EURY|nr:extracellular solute-binding protein [Halomicroarcula nitratireducens]MBX0297467.1 substrate-binding domain-containing protein [Halomicroarcula nitratireducens]